MDDALPIIVAVALAAAVGYWGHTKGRSFAESRARSSLAWQEYQNRKIAAEREFSVFREESNSAFRRDAAAIDAELEALRRTIVQTAAKSQADRNAVLSGLRSRRDALATDVPASTASGASPTASADTIRRKLDDWSRREMPDEWQKIFDAEEQTKTFRNRLAQLETQAAAKGTKPKNEPGWSVAKDRLDALETIVKKGRAVLEDEFVKAESSNILSRVRMQVEGCQSERGLSARIRALDEKALDVIADTKDRMKTPEERAAADAPSLAERAGASIKEGVSKSWKAAKGLFSSDKASEPEADGTAPEGDEGGSEPPPPEER